MAEEEAAGAAFERFVPAGTVVRVKRKRTEEPSETYCMLACVVADDWRNGGGYKNLIRGKRTKTGSKEKGGQQWLHVEWCLRTQASGWLKHL